MSKLLLLSLLAALPLGAPAQNLPSRPIRGSVDEALVAAYVPSDSSRKVTDLAAAASDGLQISTEDDVCYRIRAYIFRRDDDHVPKLVKSTTCGPRQPHTRSVTWPQAHFSNLK